MSTTCGQDSAFKDAVISNALLEEAIEWIENNMDPEDVFPRDKLEAWAHDEGYVMEDD